MRRPTPARRFAPLRTLSVSILLLAILALAACGLEPRPKPAPGDVLDLYATVYGALPGAGPDTDARDSVAQPAARDEAETDGEPEPDERDEGADTGAQPAEPAQPAGAQPMPKAEPEPVVETVVEPAAEPEPEVIAEPEPPGADAWLPPAGEALGAEPAEPLPPTFVAAIDRSPEPEPVAPSPPPPIDARPSQLMGLGAADVTALLGAPGFVRTEADAQVWQYAIDGCVLDIYLYPDEAGGPPGVVYYEIRSNGASEPRPTCFVDLVLAARGD